MTPTHTPKMDYGQRHAVEWKAYCRWQDANRDAARSIDYNEWMLDQRDALLAERDQLKAALRKALKDYDNAPSHFPEDDHANLCTFRDAVSKLLKDGDK